MPNINTGSIVHRQTLRSIQGNSVTIPHPTLITHMQFRRFAGCPVCSLHMQDFLDRYGELVNHGIQEVVVFESPAQTIKKRFSHVPFALIADPAKSLYKAFGVGTSITAMLNPRMLQSTIKGIWRHGVTLPSSVDAAFNLPADFLIASSGSVLAMKYGTHYDDQWSIEDLLSIAENTRTYTSARKAGKS